MGAGKYARMMRRRGVDPCAYVPGLYTEQEVDDLINIDGYIPVANAAEFDKIRTGASETMGGCSIWAGTYTTGIDKKYVQISTIDFTAFGTWASPIALFEGVYDGNELELNNIVLTRPLFSCLISNSAVAEFININISGTLTSIIPQSGILSTDLYGNSIVRNVHCVASVSGTSSVGGIIGDNGSSSIVGGQIIQCTFTGNVTATSGRCGGIVGLNQNNGLIESCVYTGIVSGTSIVGGVCGSLTTSAIITKSYSSGTVTASGTQVGGIVGDIANSGNLRESYSNSTVTSSSTSTIADIGGAVGRISNAGSVVEDCYSTGSATLTSTGLRVGGFIGRLGGSTIVRRCYSIGSATGGTSGGFCGSNAGSITNSYWDTVASGNATSSGGTGQTTSDLQTPTSNTGIYSAWTIPPWDFGTSTDYPVLTTTP